MTLLLNNEEVRINLPLFSTVLPSKGLQDTNNLLLDGRAVENKGKLILTEICKNMIFKSINEGVF
jgi:hypothetical protein